MRGKVYVLDLIFEWCEFFAREFKITQFKRIGTFTSFILTEILADILHKQRINKSKLQQRINMEKNKNSSENSEGKRKARKKVNKEKIKQLKGEIKAFDDRIEILKDLVDTVFETIMCYKVNDINVGIRCWCMEYIVIWINSDPSPHGFLQSKYWKYLSGGIRDRNNIVRICALNQLCNLFDPKNEFHNIKSKKKKGKREVSSKISKELEIRHQHLRGFWGRIRDYINQLCNDKDVNVAANAIKFLNILLQSDLLGMEDGDNIINFIFDENPKIRNAAADFIYFDTFDDNAVVSVVHQKLKKKEGKNNDSNSNDDNNDSNNGDNDSENNNSDDDVVDDGLKMIITNAVKDVDDANEIVQLFADRLVSLDDNYVDITERQKKRMEKALMKRYGYTSYDKNALNDVINKCGYDINNINIEIDSLQTRFVTVGDHIVECMANKLDVLTKWEVLFEMLLFSETDVNSQNISSGSAISPTTKKIRLQASTLQWDDHRQTYLCYIILSCVKYVTDKLQYSIPNAYKPIFREKKRIQERKQKGLEKLKDYLLPNIVKLLKIFKADTLKLYAFYNMILLVPANWFNGLNGKEYLDFILNHSKELFTNHEVSLIPKQANEMGTSQDNGDDNDKTAQMVKNRVMKNVNNEVYGVITRLYRYLCENEHDHKSACEEFMYPIVQDLKGSFDSIYDKINVILHDDDSKDSLSDLDKLKSSNNVDLIESLYSCLSRIKNFLGMNIRNFHFSNKMRNILQDIMDGKLYDNDRHSITSLLLEIFNASAWYQKDEVNFKTPNMDKIPKLSNDRQDFKKRFEHYLDESIKLVNQNNMEKVYYFMVNVMEHIFEGAICFMKIKNQSPLLNDVYNYDIIPESRFNDLITLYKYVIHMPILHDSYDVSIVYTKENIHIRFMIFIVKMIQCSPAYYVKLGSLLIETQYIICENNSMLKRYNDIIHNGLKVISKYDITSLQLMFMDTIKNILNIKDKNNDMDMDMDLDMDIENNDDNEMFKDNIKLIDKMCKSFSCSKGITKLPRKYFQTMMTHLCKLILNKDNEPITKYFDLLPCVLYFVQRSTNRDKLLYWELFKQKEDELKLNDIKNNNPIWKLYDTFFNKFESLAKKARVKRNLEPIIENENENDGKQDVSQIINDNEHKQDNVNDLQQQSQVNDEAKDNESQNNEEQNETEINNDNKDNNDDSKNDSNKDDNASQHDDGNDGNDDENEDEMENDDPNVINMDDNESVVSGRVSVASTRWKKRL